MNKNQTVGLDSEDDDSDDYDIAQVNCELALVEGQLCNIPYELYDLPDLTGILSVETWNSLLTEEERFFLSCFLPDMDPQTFSLTMQELLDGANLYFGNPEDKFYNNLLGGLFTPKVACFKEGVMFVKRRKYYYSLKFYHEKLIRTFTEMQRVWVQYGNKLGNYSRLLIWSGRTQTGNLKLLDLNRVPSKEMDSATCRFKTPNVVKPVERNRSKSLTFPRSGSSKNSLKIKITKEGVFRYQGSSLVSAGHHHQTLPKGVLKLVPKSSSAILRKPYVAPGNNLRQIHETGSKSTRFAASPYLGTTFEKPPYGTLGCSIPDPFLTYLETTQRSIQGTEPVFHDPTHTVPSALRVSNYSITEQNIPLKQEEYVRYHLKSPGFKPRTVDRGSETTESKRISSSNNFQREAKALRKPLGVLSEDNHAREANSDHLFSLTYKRRKLFSAEHIERASSKNLKRSSHNGVMGSLVREWVGFQQFPAATQEKLIEFFGKLKQKVCFVVVVPVSLDMNSMTVLVLGKGGVGKSSTVNSLIGEQVVRVSPFQAEGLRPVMVSRTMGGFTINIIDTPGLVEAGYVNHQALELIKGFLVNRTIDVLLYVDRLDVYRVDELDKQVVIAITQTFGKEIWCKTLLVLTHAQFSPPDELSYETFSSKRSDSLLKTIRAGSKMRKQEFEDSAIAVVYAENSGRCSKNDKDEKALPNGEAWIPNLVKAITDVATNQRKAIHVDKKMVDGSYSDDKGKKLIPLIIGAQYLIVKMIQGAIRNDIKTSGKPL
ncbi:unnamed protein product [Arabidopsis thaliana]|uniref:(thale cress) hypothetical protein n=1 Tax=Arabidopsis thaliana TaxID=3702 RepID=A0A7G2DTL9_ARATH|nr:unnamed protein product [Arabidopsis thaliana]